MDTLPFRFIWLGQTICKYQVPMDIFIVLNKIYEENFINLPDAHKQLIGRIGKENSLFFDGFRKVFLNNTRYTGSDWLIKIVISYDLYNQKVIHFGFTIFTNPEKHC